MTVPFLAFGNEKESFDVGGLTIENRFDRISVYGSIDITKDNEGLKHALMLKRLIDAAIDEMKRDKNLPDRIFVRTAEISENPFLTEKIN